MTELIATGYLVILPENGRWEDCASKSINWPREPGYDLIREIVDPLVGGHLEHVHVLRTNFANGSTSPADLFVNDEGNMPGRHLPVNPLATFLYHTFTRLQRSKKDWADAPPICGPAVLFNRRVWF